MKSTKTNIKALVVGLALTTGSAVANTAETDQLIIVFNNTSSVQSLSEAETIKTLEKITKRKARLKRRAQRSKRKSAIYKLDKKLTSTEMRAHAKELSKELGVRVEPDFINQPMATVNDTYYSKQWHLSEDLGGISVEGAWDTSTGAGTVVAVLDTGYLPHKDLVGNLLPGYDMVTKAADARDGDGRDDDARDEGDYLAANECGYTHNARNSSWHGTHVAGTIAATANNYRGVAGVAYDAKILPVRVLGRCGGYTSDIVDGIRWAAGLEVEGLPVNPNPAHVINMSLGSNIPCSSSTAYQSAINDARQAGVTIVVAAGNSNVDAANVTPASCDGVITVAASNRSAEKASYSNYGAVVDIAAPGGDAQGAVFSTLDYGTTGSAGDVYAFYAGTSMAAPHVAGVAALMYSTQPEVSPEQVETIIKEASRPFASSSNCSETCGTGLLDANIALQHLLVLDTPDEDESTDDLEPPVTDDSPEVLTPFTPTEFTAEFDATNTVHLNWTNVLYEQGYVIERQYLDNGEWTATTSLAELATDVTETADNLTVSGLYQYRVAGYNEHGSSDWSPWVEVTVKVPVLEVAPKRPETVKVTATESTVKAQWSDVKNETGYIVHHQKRVKRYGKRSWKTQGYTRITEAGMTEWAQSHKGKASHRIRVSAYNDFGRSKWTVWQSVRTR